MPPELHHIPGGVMLSQRAHRIGHRDAELAQREMPAQDFFLRDGSDLCNTMLDRDFRRFGNVSSSNHKAPSHVDGEPTRGGSLRRACKMLLSIGARKSGNALKWLTPRFISEGETR